MERKRGICGICGRVDDGVNRQPFCWTKKMPRKFGVKIRMVTPQTMNPVRLSAEESANVNLKTHCAGCGRTHEDCHEWWTQKLGIRGHEASSSGGVETQYAQNLRVMREFETKGEDSFCFNANMRAYEADFRRRGVFIPVWTPKMVEERPVYHSAIDEYLSSRSQDVSLGSSPTGSPIGTKDTDNPRSNRRGSATGNRRGRERA